MSDKAWVTLATNDTYSLGALVVAQSLKKVKTPHNLVVLITPGVTPRMRTLLHDVFHEVREVNILDSKDEKNLRLLQRPELGVTFTKLHCWKLTHYTKCVFLDADTLVLKNCDELFDREELSAAPDVGWPDCFNSGVFVFKPLEETFEKLVSFALAHGSFDGGDQGLLNMFFSDWATSDIRKHLPFVYNLCSAAIYSYMPAFKWFGKDIKIVHFISGSKPWLQSFNTQTRTVQPPIDSPHLKGLLQIWWDLFCTYVHPSLSTEMGGLAACFAHLKLDEPLTGEQLAIEDQIRRQNWEQGNIDFMGKDAFENIWEKIRKTMNSFEEKQEIPSQSTKEIQGEPEADVPLEFTAPSSQKADAEKEEEIRPTDVIPRASVSVEELIATETKEELSCSIPQESMGSSETLDVSEKKELEPHESDVKGSEPADVKPETVITSEPLAVKEKEDKSIVETPAPAVSATEGSTLEALSLALPEGSVSQDSDEAAVPVKAETIIESPKEIVSSVEPSVEDTSTPPPSTELSNVLEASSPEQQTADAAPQTLSSAEVISEEASSRAVQPDSEVCAKSITLPKADSEIPKDTLETQVIPQQETEIKKTVEEPALPAQVASGERGDLPNVIATAPTPPSSPTKKTAEEPALPAQVASDERGDLPSVIATAPTPPSSPTDKVKDPASTKETLKRDVEVKADDQPPVAASDVPTSPPSLGSDSIKEPSTAPQPPKSASQPGSSKPKHQKGGKKK